MKKKITFIICTYVLAGAFLMGLTRCDEENEITAPVLTTTEITEITATTALCGGNITTDGGATVTARGVCWSTSKNPTIGNAHTTDSSGTGVFTSNLTGLNPGILYYVRAYATNSVGNAYGNQQTFTTSSGLPLLTTAAVTYLQATSATCGGNITSDGGFSITARGVCWSTSQNPTVSGPHTTDGTGTGSFTSNITGLNPGILYYVRAYATNSAGTDYGSQVSFTTTSTVTDYDGNVYNTVTIGTQTWMAENLKTTHYKDATEIQLVTDAGTWGGLTTGAYCYYDNNAANAATYGALYNWYAVSTGNLCPTGWHVPSDNEFKTLEMYLGMTQAQADAMGLRGTDQSSQLKSTSGWNNNGNGSNSCGFSALPSGGRYNDGTFANIGNYGYFWSLTESNNYEVWYRVLSYEYSNIYRVSTSKDGGFSVRCLRDF